MIKSLSTEIKKNLYLPYFVAGIFLVLSLGFMSDAVRGIDGKSYSVFELLTLSKKLRLTSNTDFAWVAVWKKSFGKWLKLIIPVVVSSGFVLNHTEETKKDYSYFLYSRESRFRFAVTKVLGAAISAGMIFSIGYLLVGLILLPFFPKIGEFSRDNIQFLEYIYGTGNTRVYIIKIFLGSFMYGIYASLFPVFLSAFISDRYILLSIPVLFQYAVDVSVTKLFIENMDNKYADVIQAFDMNNMINAFSHKYWWHEFAGVWFLVVLIILVHYLAVKKEARP